MPKQNTESSVGASKRKDLRKKGVSKHKRAGLTFPVSRVHRAFKKGNFSPRIGLGAAIVTTAALEYLAAEIFELAGKAAAANEKKRITPRYLMLAIKNDAELSKDVQIPQSGVLPGIQSILLHTLKQRKSLQKHGELADDETLSSQVTTGEKKKPKKKKPSKKPKKDEKPAGKKKAAEKPPKKKGSEKKADKEEKEKEKSASDEEEASGSSEEAPSKKGSQKGKETPSKDASQKGKETPSKDASQKGKKGTSSQETPSKGKKGTPPKGKGSKKGTPSKK